MIKNKAKLIILLSFVYHNFIVLKGVSCRGIPVIEKNEKDNDDVQGKGWRDKWKEQHKKWHMDSSYYDSAPYINVVRGNSKEWSNMEHAQPLKRSDDAAAFPAPPITNDLNALNISNPISKYHCPINLLYGNNLTVKNYFLLVPRGNESCNDTINQIQNVSDEKLEYNTMHHGTYEYQGDKAGAEGNISVETMSIKEETTSSLETTSLSPNTTVELNTTMPETTANETSSPESTTAPQLTEKTTLAQDIMRTLDKYCETFNMSDLGTYTIQPVNISIGTSMEEKGNITNSIVDEKTALHLIEDKVATNSSESTVLKKQKRTPSEGTDCVNFNISSNENYTINPVPLPHGSNGNVAELKVLDMKKIKRNFTSKRPKKRKSVR